MRIQKKKISEYNPPFIIAEIGINHNGNINNAFKLIDYAAAAKCDAVKFQTIKVNNLMVKNAPLADYQKKTKFRNMNELINRYHIEKV